MGFKCGVVPSPGSSPCSVAARGDNLARWLLLGRAARRAQYGAKSTSRVRKANVFLEKRSLLEKAVVGNRRGNAAHVVVIKARPFLDPEIMQ